MLIMVKFRSRHRVKQVRFLLKNSTFHLNRTLFLEGPNEVKNVFPHFINITSFPRKKTTGENENLPFLGFSSV